MANANRFSRLVVVGASAGGIDALSTLLTTLPPDFSAPVVIAQHLDPTHPSRLGEILARHSTLPVRTVASSDQLEPGVVYVAPANRDVCVNDHEVRLETSPLGHPQPSVDRLLSSAAEIYGERLIAVILSGTGSDGATGARAVKWAGGIVIIQDPETAAYPGMPRSLAPTSVDIVAPLERIGPILRDLLAGVKVPTSQEENGALKAFLDQAQRRYGIDFTRHSPLAIRERLQRRIVATGTRDLTAYMEYLNDHPQEHQQLVNTFVVKPSAFLRDADQFAYLRDTVLPNLIAQARQRDYELRVWCAGCATGEDAYSLAILLAEALGDELERFTVRIFATDANADVISYARGGLYPASALAELPEELVARHFVEVEGSYRLVKRVRALVLFGEHDLSKQVPFPRIDLIICRNILSHITRELQRRVLHVFAYSLRDGGYLVLDRRDTPGGLLEYLAPQDQSRQIYRRQGGRILLPPAYFMQAAPPSLYRTLLDRLSSAGQLESRDRLPRARTLDESALLRLPVGVVVVDRRYDIRAINSTARLFFAIHDVAVGEDLIHLIRGEASAKLRAAIDTAFHSRSSTSVDEVVIEEATTDAPRYLQLVCHAELPVGLPAELQEGEQEPAQTVMVVVHDITSLVRARMQAEEQVRSTTTTLRLTQAEAEEEIARRDQTIARLMATNRQLVEANRDLLASNEQLRVSSEDLLTNAESNQASAEEIVTLNEELQGTNEELETLNEELQSTVEELNMTNSGLDASTVELRELARASEEERARLAAILVSLGDAVLVVGNTGLPLQTNAAYQQMFGVDGAGFVPLDEEGRPLPPEATPQQRAARGELFRMDLTITAPDGSRKWLEVNGQPIRNAEGAQQGGVIVIRDITDRSLRRLQDEFVAWAGHELRVPLTPISGYLQRLLKVLDDQPPNADSRRYATRALTQVYRLSKLLDELLDATRLQLGKYTLTTTRVELGDVVAQCVEMAQMLTAGQTIALDSVGGPFVVDGDADRLQQVVLNLLTNAITYAPNTERIDVRLRRADGEAELQVQDYGPGVPAAELPHLFSRFYQAPQRHAAPNRGLGLGLFIAREITMAHGGTISASSTEGEGTTFTLRLPLVGGSPARSSGRPPRVRLPRRKKTQEG